MSDSTTTTTTTTTMETATITTTMEEDAPSSRDRTTALPFPSSGILPKEETGSASFISKNPQWDGRGIRVAIFDTGVDPGAAGLSGLTTDGKPKIVDVVDCTGGGDVDTSEVRTIKRGDDNGDRNGSPDGTPPPMTVVGLTGRTLTLGDWAEGLTEVRVGVKRAYELFPGPLTERVKAERKVTFAEAQSAAVAVAQRCVVAVEGGDKCKHAAKKNEPSSPSSDATKDGDGIDGEEKKRREKKDCEAVLGALKDAAEKYDDAGPAFDCVVFEDGDGKWRAVIDTNGSGDLTNCVPLTNYRDERRYLTINTVPGCKEVSLLLNYCVTVFEGGNRLSIVCDSGAHGTHVAGIVAAHFADTPELDGVAPGAQIVSCKIGDSRLGSMETGVGLTRALIVARDNGCQIINMSFGESFVHGNRGRFFDLATEFVERHGMVFVTSAGNNGPALTTVGAPGGTCSAMISVGAYVSPGMMEVEYSLREHLPGTNYTWSSRGPAPDGRAGISVCAPGGAIAPVPTWSLQGKRLMNGTSMSSPNCAGGIALALSALASEGVGHTPAAVRRAVENGAANVPGVEPWALGAGLLRVPEAHGLLRAYATSRVASLSLRASLPARGGAEGLYLREPAQTERKTAATVLVEPLFRVDCDNTEKVRFEVRVVLESTAEWCVVPNAMVLGAAGKGFELVVDPHALTPGTASFAEVRGFDASAPHLGPIFRFPVTVIKPKKVAPSTAACDAGDFALAMPRQRFSPGSIDRHFVAAPAGATWVEVTLRTREVEGSHMLVMHALQVLPSSPATGRNPTEHQKYMRLQAFTTVTERVNVVGGATVELCLCKWWASLGSVEVDVEVTFHGLQLSTESIFIGTDEPSELTINAPLNVEKIEASAKLTTLRKALVPNKHAMRQTMDERNTLPQQRYIYELELSYSFEQTEKEAVKVQPRAPMFELLYDSPFESQLWMVYDANKQLMGTGDALYPYPLTLSKGKYTMKVMIRHDKKSMLDKMKSLIMPVDFALAKELAVTLHTTLHGALIGEDKYSSGALARGGRLKLFVAPPSDKAPAFAKHGDVLVGKVRVGRADCALRVLVPKEAAKDEAKKEGPSDKKSDEELEREEVRDARLKRLKTLRGEKKWEAFDALAKTLRVDFPSHLPLLEEVLSRRDAKAEDDETCEAKQKRCEEAIEAAGDVAKAVDAAALAQHFGVKHDSDDPAVKKVCEEMDKKKKALLAALLCKVERFLEMLGPAPLCAAREGMSLEGVVEEGAGAIETLQALWVAVQQWWVAADQGHDEKMRHVRLFSQVRRREGRPGAAGTELLKLLKCNEGAPTKAVVEEMTDLCKQMKWENWVLHYKDLTLKLFPAKEALM